MYINIDFFRFYIKNVVRFAGLNNIIDFILRKRHAYCIPSRFRTYMHLKVDRRNNINNQAANESTKQIRIDVTFILTSFSSLQSVCKYIQ